MALTRGFTDEIKQLNAEPIIGNPADELLSTTMTRIGKHTNSPVRLYASTVPDEYLNIGPNFVEAGDLAGKVTPPIYDIIPTFTGATIGFQSKTATATVVIDGSAFTFPATTVGEVRCLAMALMADGTIACRWSDPAANVSLLVNPGTLLSTLDGLPIGYIYLECTAADGKFKTVGSTTSVIENKAGGSDRIFRFGAGGGGGGGGGDKSFKIGNITSTGIVTIKGGYLALSDGRVLATYDGSGTNETDFGVDLTVTMGTLGATSDGVYYLYVNTALATAVSTDYGRTLYKVSTSELYASTKKPDFVDRRQYFPVGTLKRSGGTWVATGYTYPSKKHYNESVGDESFRVWEITAANELTTKSGSLYLGDGKELITTGITIPLSSISVDGGYYFYIDMLSLPLASSSGRRTYTVAAGNIVYSTVAPELQNLARYLYLCYVERTGGSWVLSSLSSRGLKVVPTGLNMNTNLEYSSTLTPVGTVGTLGQMAAGHNLTSASFNPSQFAANISFYGLASVSDGNTALAHNLTNTGAVAFTGTGILGVANSCASFSGANQLESTDIHFDPVDSGSTFDFTAGGWFNATSWASAAGLFGQWVATKLSYAVVINASGYLTVQATVDGANAVSSSYEVALSSGWHHITIKYVAATNTFYLFLDRVVVATLTLSGNLYNAGATRKFTLGSLNGTSYFTGLVDEFFFSSGYALTDNEIDVTYAYKLTHNKNLAPVTQDWRASISYGGIIAPLALNIVDVDSNDLYLILSGENASSQVSLSLHNKGQIGGTAAVRSFSRAKTAAELDVEFASSVAHYLPSVPTANVMLVQKGTGYWEQHDWSSYFEVNDTAIVKMENLTSIMGGSTNIVLIFSVGAGSVAIPPADTNTPGILPVVNYQKRLVTAVDVTASKFQILHVDTTTAVRTVTLPASPSAGDTVTVADAKNNFSINACVLGRNGKLIRGLSIDFDCDISNKIYTVVYIDDTYGWEVYV